MIDLYHGDCLEILPTLEAGSVDMVLADPPYQTTQLSWDSAIPLAPLWEQLKRVIKPNGTIVLFGSDPFTSVLITSNLKQFRYRLVWEKDGVTGFLDANRKPMKCHEDIAVFYERQPTYNPQMTPTKRTVIKRQPDRAPHYGSHPGVTSDNNGQAYPRTVIYCQQERGLHPTQKPVPLLSYLIRTYTTAGDTVLDFCMGSGSTIVACIEEGRNGIGIEQDATYFEIAKKRIEQEQTKPRTMRMELA